MPLAVRNVHEIPGAKDRTKGELIELGGTGLVVVGRPPLFATVRFDERDTAPSFPLAPSTAISQRFTQFYIFHPFVEAGTFRFIILQGSDWLEQPNDPERLRYSGFASLPSIAGTQWAVQLYNNPKPTTSFNSIRIVRVQRVSIAALAGATRYILARVEAAGTPLTKLETPMILDGRITVDAQGTSIGQAEVQGGTGLTLQGNAFQVVAFDSTRNPTLDIDLDMVLMPGMALQVYQPDTTIAQAHDITFKFTEEPFN